MLISIRSSRSLDSLKVVCLKRRANIARRERTTVGWRGVLSYGPESDKEANIQRSMLDSFFPELEEVLEQEVA